MASPILPHFVPSEGIKINPNDSAHFIRGQLTALDHVADGVRMASKDFGSLFDTEKFMHKTSLDFMGGLFFAFSAKL